VISRRDKIGNRLVNVKCYMLRRDPKSFPGIISPEANVTPELSMATMVIPGRVSIPRRRRACSITGRALSPMSEPIFDLWSARITRKGRVACASARIGCNFPGISVADSLPVRPAPTTTTFYCPGESGCLGNAWRWALSRAAPP